MYVFEYILVVYYIIVNVFNFFLNYYGIKKSLLWVSK